MKNLKIAVVRRKWFNLQLADDTSHLTGNELFCFNSFSNTLFYACASGIFQMDEETRLLCKWPDIVWNKVPVSFDFISDDFRLCAIFQCGVALFLDLDTLEVEISNLKVSQIFGASWAPDFHVLVVNSKNTVFFFSRELELIRQDDLIPSNAGKEELVTLGWGSKDTQFQGSAGRKKLQEEHIETETIISEHDKGKVEYSWSGDAKFVAVSSVNPQKAIRMFFIWSDEGDLISRLSTIEGAGSSIAFNPSGVLIAVNRVLNDCQEIVLFERNGQKRSQFSLFRTSDCYVSWLCWNMDSSLLAIRLQFSNKTANEIQFWRRSNYKWQMKYCLDLKEKLIYMSWNPECPMTFHLLGVCGDMMTLSFDVTYDFNNMSVIFLDVPNSVCFTDFFLGPVPPPMSHCSYQFPSPVCEIAFSLYGAVFLLSNHNLFFYKREDRKLCFDRQYCVNNDVLPFCSLSYNLQYPDKNIVSMIVCSGHKSSSYSIVMHRLDASFKSSVIYQSNIPLLWHQWTKEGVIVQTSTKEWLIVCPEGGDVPPKRCDWVSPGVQENERLSTLNFLSKVRSVIALTRNNVLLVNGQEFCANVGSYSVDDELLIFIILPSRDTTSKLFVISTEDLIKAKRPYTPVGGRNVERGAVIIGHETDGTRVWLQMPRGNLETIHLRTLLLKKLENCLKIKNYKEAIKLMRKHRIDMNFIFDRDPEGFLKSIPKFIDSVDDADLLNLFISNLNAENSVEMLYAHYYSNEAKENSKIPEDKVNIICENMRNYLVTIDLEKLMPLFTCILSTYVKMDPKQISEALLAVHHYASRIENGEIMREKWLDYLALLLPNENLFKEALGVYDLGLAATVAKNSKMDPKEFIAILSNFNSITSLPYQRFRIDVWLGRYEKALAHIVEVPEKFDEVKGLIEQRQLYSAALKIFCGKPHYLDICVICAEHLFSRRSYAEAAILYLRASKYDEALRCAEMCGNWEMFLKIAKKAKLSNLDIAQRLENIATFLEKRERYRDCAALLISLERNEDRSRILKLLILGSDWKRLTDFVCGDTALEEAAAQSLLNQKTIWSSDFSEWRAEWDNFSSRLELLRQMKKKKLQVVIESGVMEYDETASELFSETSSVVSGASRASFSTTASSRSRKHRERKKAILKPGSQYEDAAILNSLKLLAERANSLQLDMRSFLEALVALNLVQDANDLQHSFAELLEHFKNSLPKIWPTVLEPHLLVGPISEIFRCDDGIIRYSSEGGMPLRMILDQELYPPNLKCNETWMLDILKS